MNIKIEIINLLKEMENGKYSNILLNNFFKKNNFNYKEKSFVSEVFYGVIRNDIFIDYIISKFTQKIKKKELYYLLKISVYQGIYMDSDEKGVVWEAAEITKAKYGNKLTGFVNGVLRNIFRNYKDIMEELKKNEKYDILFSYPKWVIENFKEKYKNEYIDALKSYKEIPNISFRVNTLKYTKEDFEIYLKENNIDILKNIENIYYVNSGKILESDIFKEGKVFVQDGSSYLAAMILEAKENESVLDVCAAPGTKTIVIAENMNNKGNIKACDIYEHKLKLIKDNAEKAGVNIIEPLLLDALELKNKNYEFDKIIADVPCSGFGVIRKKPESLYNKKIEDIKNISKLQYDILESAASRLKIGGTLVYSTCTIFDIENKENIKKFLENNTNFKSESIDFSYNINYEKDEYGGIQINYKEKYLDGFYFIKLKRVG